MLLNKPQGCGAFVAAAEEPFSTNMLTLNFIAIFTTASRKNLY
jgi:hypothetical protein